MSWLYCYVSIITKEWIAKHLLIDCHVICTGLRGIISFFVIIVALVLEMYVN